MGQARAAAAPVTVVATSVSFVVVLLAAWLSRPVWLSPLGATPPPPSPPDQPGAAIDRAESHPTGIISAAQDRVVPSPSPQAQGSPSPKAGADAGQESRLDGEPEAAGEDTSIDVCKHGVDFMTIESLLQQRSTPCLVRGLFDHKKKEKVLRAWSLRTLAKNKLILHSPVQLRITKGANVTQVMRYSTRSMRPSWQAFQSAALGATFPRDEYDAWEFQSTTIAQSIFSTRRDLGASFSTNVEGLQQAIPKGVKSVMKLMKSVCPYGCSDQMAKDQLIWITSAGLGQQLHFDAHANLFLHIDGDKSIVLSPPDAVVRSAHLFPKQHPAARQSQLRWSGPGTDRTMNGFTTAVGSDGDRPPPMYTHLGEKVVRLRRGDVLYLPAYWGHQTFGGNTPTVSLALWFFPTAVDPRRRPQTDATAQREGGFHDARMAAARAAIGVSPSPALIWAAMRSLGEAVVKRAFDVNETGAGTYIEEWRNQRWRPQFGGLGIDAGQTVPEATCKPTRHSAVTDTAADRLVAHIQAMAAWHLEEHRSVIVWNYVADTLDSLVDAWIRAKVAPALEAAGVHSTAGQLGALLHSFGACSAASLPR